jgi:hypothetical protein
MARLSRVACADTLEFEVLWARAGEGVGIMRCRAIMVT